MSCLAFLHNLQCCELWVCGHLFLHVPHGKKKKTCTPRPLPSPSGCLDDCTTPQLDTVTLRPAPSDTVTICPKRFHIETIRPHRGWTVRPHPNRSVRPLRSGSKCWLWQSDPFSASPGGLGDSSGDNTQMALLKNGVAPPEKTSPTHGSAGRKLDLT